MTLVADPVADPVDGTANAAAGVPLSAFAGAIAVDGVPTEALTAGWTPAGAGTRSPVGERSCALEVTPDFRRRWSGVVAATPELAEELATTIHG